MQTAVQSAPIPSWRLWTGRVLTTLVVLLLLMGSVMSLMKVPQAVEGFKKYGYPEGSLLWIGVAELACALLYAIPRTAVLGAMLLTGYLGGAVATHVHAGEPNFWIPIVVGIIAWAALYLREPRLHSLVPLRD
jgi:hypothetical protein